MKCEHCGEEFTPKLLRHTGPTRTRFCGRMCRQRAWRQANPDKVKAKMGRWRRKPEGQYRQARDQANQRGIPWEFTFQEWLDWWGEDLPKRGMGGLYMCRRGDTGPYSPSNTYKGTASDNLRDAYRNGRR